MMYKTAYIFYFRLLNKKVKFVVFFIVQIDGIFIFRTINFRFPTNRFLFLLLISSVILAKFSGYWCNIPRFPTLEEITPSRRWVASVFVQHEEFHAAQNTTCYVPMNMNLPAANYCDHDITLVFFWLTYPYWNVYNITLKNMINYLCIK